MFKINWQKFPSRLQAKSNSNMKVVITKNAEQPYLNGRTFYVRQQTYLDNKGSEISVPMVCSDFVCIDFEGDFPRVHLKYSIIVDALMEQYRLHNLLRNSNLNQDVVEAITHAIEGLVEFNRLQQV
jgi:hypothetical protein